MRGSVDVSATLPTLMCIYCLVVAAGALHHQHKHLHNYRQQHHNHHSQQHAMREQRQLRATHFFRPLPLRQQFNTGASSPVSTQGRAAAATGTGRGLLKKFTMFRNMFHQPQNSNVIIITQPTTTTTPTTTGTATATTATSTPTTTTTTTRNARHNAAAIGRPHGGRLPNDVPVVLGGGAHGIDSKIALDAADGEDDVGGTAEEASYAEHSGLQQHKRKRIRQGMQQIGNLNKTPVRRVDGAGAGAGVGVDVDVNLGGTNDIGNDGGIAVVNRNANKRKRRRKINKKAKQNKNANTNGFANNNKNSNNIKHTNDSATDSSGSIFDLNTNSRIQNLFMNAFRLQTPVVYNH